MSRSLFGSLHSRKQGAARKRHGRQIAFAAAARPLPAAAVRPLARQQPAAVRATIRAMRKLQLDELALFARVAELGSLSAVARERDVPVSQVSRTLVRLEKACGARLVNRSTHGLSLTDEGRTFLEYSRRALETMEELEGAFAERTGEPSGVVRVASSTVVAQYQLVPSLKGLAERHPRLQVEMEVGDRLLDLAREGIDISIRTAASLPDTVVARQIGTLGRALYAAPGYAREHG